MTALDCPREQDVLDALASRRWPSRCDEELRTHVAACAACSDLLEVARALIEAREGADDAPRVPSASVVWWRAQLRAREEAARLAMRPLRLARVAAVSCACVLALVALQAIWPSLWSWLDAVLAWRPALDPDAASAALSTAFASRVVQLATACWLVLAPVALYFALARD